MLPLPNLRRLEAAGAYSYYASTQWTGATYSGPGWASVFTGVEPARLGVRGNSDMGNAAANGFPTFVARAAALACGLLAALRNPKGRWAWYAPSLPCRRHARSHHAVAARVCGNQCSVCQR